jgi:type IV pilus assembly protein PilA
MAIRRNGYSMMEMMAVLAIMAILSMMVVPTYLDRIVRQQIEAALPLADIARKPIAEWWSATLTFPHDNAALLLPAPDKIVNNYINRLTVQDGVINITFGNRANGSLIGKTLSLRPAVVPDAPVVPITWVCGMADAPQNMVVQGTNLTDVPEVFLPLDCRTLKRN